MNPSPTAAPRRPLRRALRVAGLLLAIGAVAIGVDYGYWVLVEHRMIAIADSDVFQAAEMPPDTLVTVSKDHGIKAVIDLRDTRPEAIDAERAALEAAGIKHLHVPSLQDPRPETIATVLGLMNDPANRPLLVHCEHGEGRSVLMAALYRVEKQGWTNEAAWRASARLPSNLHFLADWFPGLATFGRDSAKGRILFDYQPGKASDGAPTPREGNSR